MATIESVQSKDAKSLLDLPPEVGRDVMQHFDSESNISLHLRVTCRALNGETLSYYADQSKAQNPHPFATITFGLDPAYLQGMDTIANNPTLRHLPWQIQFDFNDASIVQNPRRLDFEFMKEGTWYVQQSFRIDFVVVFTIDHDTTASRLTRYMVG